MKVKLNGADIIWNGTTNVTIGGDTDTNFVSGEQLNIRVFPALASGDTLSVVYTPTGDILQRVKLA